MASARAVDDAADDEPPACYVCTEEEGARPLQCACRTMHAHPQCLLRVAAGRADDRCPVCTQPMRTVRVERRRVWARGLVVLDACEAAIHVATLLAMVRIFLFVVFHPHGFHGDMPVSIGIVTAATTAIFGLSAVSCVRLGMLTRRPRTRVRVTARLCEGACGARAEAAEVRV